MVAYSCIALVLVIVLQVAILFWALGATNVLKREWPKVVRATPAHVYVVQMDSFWGPVTAIVPDRCQEMALWKRVVADSDANASVDAAAAETGGPGSGHNGTAGSAALQRQNASAPDVLAVDQVSTHEDTLEQRRLAFSSSTFEVQACGRTLRFSDVSNWNSYFSMVTLSNVLIGRMETAQELHSSRLRLYQRLIYGIVVCMCLKYTLKITDLAAGCFGHQYVQLWNHSRTTFDRVLESLMLHGVALLFTLAMQITLCALFLTFWLDDHFVMSYLPSFGLPAFFVTLLAMICFFTVDRCFGLMARCGPRYIYAFWCTWLLWMVLIAIPMMGYCLNTVNFMWQVADLGWVRQEESLFSRRFVTAAHTAAKATHSFVAVTVVEMVVIIMLDLKRF